MGSFRLRRGLLVSFQRYFDGMTNLWHLCEHVSYAFATTKLRSEAIEGHSSAVKFFHRESRGFELDTPHSVLTNALKGAARSHDDAGNQATVRRPVS